jgi:hypothetical protein
MDPIRWHRLAPLTGVVAVILWAIGVAVLDAEQGRGAGEGP